ncbi:helix-turn-helix transcriptional regulator [Streptomyces sp. NPDC006475]|uniref:helix-turn-helix domain-containing protein n=1 Tax=Streptomyces sp. NPDC006475 TaxID=3155719 RepID=UPI00339E2893
MAPATVPLLQRMTRDENVLQHIDDLVAAGAERFWSELTDREKDTARLVARGRPNREIAGELYLSTKTVEYYLGKMYATGELRNRRQLRDLVQALTARAVGRGNRSPCLSMCRDRATPGG